MKTSSWKSINIDWKAAIDKHKHFNLQSRIYRSLTPIRQTTEKGFVNGVLAKCALATKGVCDADDCICDASAEELRTVTLAILASFGDNEAPTQLRMSWFRTLCNCIITDARILHLAEANRGSSLSHTVDDSAGGGSSRNGSFLRCERLGLRSATYLPRDLPRSLLSLFA